MNNLVLKRRHYKAPDRTYEGIHNRARVSKAFTSESVYLTYYVYNCTVQCDESDLRDHIVCLKLRLNILLSKY